MSMSIDINIYKWNKDGKTMILVFNAETGESVEQVAIDQSNERKQFNQAARIVRKMVK